MSNKNLLHIQRIKKELPLLLEKLKGDDPEANQEAMEGYLRLVDDFYRANDHYVAPQQYDAAKKDVKYLMRLLYLAEHHYPGGYGVKIVLPEVHIL